jgi:hypothetical protein
MKKISKEELKEILKDEPYQEYEYDLQDKSFGRKRLEGIINFLRFELLYPKMKEEYNIRDGYENFPKGVGSAVIANSFLGACIYGKDNLAEGALIGGACTFVQLVLGFGIRYGCKYVSKKYKEFKK